MPLMLLPPPGVPFSPSKTIRSYLPQSPCWPFNAQLVTSSEKSSLMFPRAPKELVASSLFPGGTLFHASVLTPVTPSLHLEHSVVLSACPLGRRG